GEEVGAWRGRLREALGRLDRAARLHADVRSRTALVQRADCLEGLGAKEEARRARREAERGVPVLAAACLLVGLGHYHRGEPDEALGALSGALRLQPGHYGARYLLGACQLQGGQWREAKVSFSTCLEQRPGFAWPRLQRSVAAMELKE